MERTVGISFSKNQCFVAQISREKDVLSLTKSVSFPYENDLFTALKINATTLKDCIAQSSRTIVALSFSDILLQRAAIDAVLTDTEIMRYIHSQSTTLFGHDSKKLCIDYETQQVANNHRQIMIAACLQTTVLRYQQCFTELALPLHVIDIDVFALCRLLEFHQSANPTILLFHQDQWLQVISIQDNKPQRSERLDISSDAALSHLNSYLSDNTRFVLISEDDELKKRLNEMSFSYEEFEIGCVKNHTSLQSLQPFLVSVGSGLWSKR